MRVDHVSLVSYIPHGGSFPSGGGYRTAALIGIGVLTAALVVSLVFAASRRSYGAVPAWRALSVGVTGGDVTQLNDDLVAMGYADAADVAALGWDFFSWETRFGLEQLQYARWER